MCNSSSLVGSPCLEGQGREPGNEATFLVHMDTITFFDEKVRAYTMVNFPIWSTSHFVNLHFVNSHFVNIDQMEIAKVGY